MTEPDSQIKAKDISTFIVLAQKLLWAPENVRKQIELAGISLTPCNYYSTIPSLSEIHESVVQSRLKPPSYMRSFNDSEMLSFLREIVPYATDFTPETEETSKGYYWNNRQFSHSDAMAYFAIVRHRKPKRIVEIGSGFSTLVAAEAIRQNGFGEVICIEPYPRDFLSSIPQVHLEQRTIQSFSNDEFLGVMDSADILFVDSTHTVKIGSDCLYIYLCLIPALRKKLLIHAHDIFLPFDMPVEWATKHHIYWTEQYLLYAYLLENPYVTIKYSSAFLAAFHKKELDQFMLGKATTGGVASGSNWTAAPISTIFPLHSTHHSKGPCRTARARQSSPNAESIPQSQPPDQKT